MGFNKKVLSKAVSELDKAKAPAKPKDIITDPMGQWKYPGKKTRIPGSKITMEGVDTALWAQPNIGAGKLLRPNEKHDFGDAVSYVDETPITNQIARKGGTLQSKKYSKSMSATNKLFAKNNLFKNKKSKIFDPNSKFKKGGSKLGPINLDPNPLSHYELNYGFNLPTKQDGGPQYTFPERDLYPEEDEYFRNNPHVGGMVAEDNHVIINPYSKLKDYEKDAIRQNEGARLAMRNGHPRPTFNLTDEQKEKFKDYSNDEQDQRETIIGRIISGDPSVGKVSPEQQAYADELSKLLKPAVSLKNTSGPRNNIIQEDEYMDLTDEEIQAYRDGGYVVEEEPEYEIGGYVQHELVKAQKGLTKKPLEISDPKEFAYRNKMYGDSLALYNYTKLQKKLEQAHDSNGMVPLYKQVMGVKPGLTEQGRKDNLVLKQEVDKILKQHPDIKIGTFGNENISPTKINRYGDIVPNPKKAYYSEYASSGSFDIHHPKIKPAGQWRGIAMNEDYSNAKPTQPVVFKKISIDKKSETKKSTKPTQKNTTSKPVQPVTLKKGNNDYIKPSTQFEKQKTDDSIITDTDVVPEGYRKMGSNYVASRDEKTGKVTEKEKFMYEPIPQLATKPMQQFITPEQTIIPGKPYIKSVQYSGSRYGSLAGDENLDLPSGYTQEEREAARRQRDTNDWLRKTQEYQSKQRGNKPIAKAQVGLTKKPLKISDPDEYAFRKAAYDDSLTMHRLYDNDYNAVKKFKTINEINNYRNSQIKSKGKQENAASMRLGNPNPEKVETHTNLDGPYTTTTYKKPVQPVQFVPNIKSTSKKGVWSGGSEEQFPTGINTSDFERKTREYQEKQRGNKSVAQVRKDGGALDIYQKKGEVKTFKRDIRDQDAQSNTGWSSAPVQKKKVVTTKKTPTTLKEKLNQTPQQAFDNDFKVVTAKENAILKEKNREQNNTFKNQQMPGYKDYGPQSAGSADWFWTLPIAGPAALEAASSIGAMSLPGLSSVPGATVGNLFNASTIAEGINQTPETIKAWNDVTKGKKSWSDAALETGINLSEFIGSGSSVKSLAQDVNQGAKYLNKGIKTASNYGKDLAYSSKQAGKLKFPTYQPVSRWDPEHIPYSLQQAGRDLTPEQQALTGSWYSYKPKGATDYEHTIGFYPTNRPGPGTLKHLRLSEREIANLENSMSDAAKGMSGKSESVTTSSDYLKGELNLPQYLRNKTKSVKFDVNPSEYIPQSHGTEPRSSFGMGQTGQHIADVLKSQYPNFAGIPRQYLPFKNGGAITEAWEDELDDHTIELLRRAGYIVEEID